MISIDWPTGIISIPQSYLTFLSGVRYELDVNQFRLDLKSLEDDEEGSVWPTTHNHNTEVVLSGVTYARSIEIINGYTVEFEDGQYTVVVSGANHNLADVKVANQVSLIIGNSAGLISVDTGGGGGSDPWLTTIPAAYSSGTAGNILGNLATVGVKVNNIAANTINRAAFAPDTGLQPSRSNTAQSGSAGTIVLDSGASSVDNYYKNQIIYLTSGTGLGQTRLILGYAGATKTVIINEDWATIPDNSTTFSIFGFAIIEEFASTWS